MENKVELNANEGKMTPVWWVIFGVLVLIAGTLFGMYFMRVDNVDTTLGNKRSYEKIASDARYGQLVYVSTREESGATNYTDDRYSYWFNRDDLLISRICILQDGGEERTITSNEAYRLAIEELDVYLEDTDFNEGGWTSSVYTTDSPNSPWEVLFVFTDFEGVETKRHRVEINKNGIACYLTLSEEERSVEQIALSEEDAIAAAYEAVASELNQKGFVDVTADTIRSNTKISRSQRRLFAYEGNSIWSILVPGITLPDKEDAAYLVQIDAVSGEIRLIEECR